MAMLSHVHQLFSAEHCQAYIHTLRWKDRPLQCPRCGYPLKAGQLTYDCRYSTMHGMPVTGGRGFRGLKPLWYNSVPP